MDGGRGSQIDFISYYCGGEWFCRNEDYQQVGSVHRLAFVTAVPTCARESPKTIGEHRHLHNDS